MRQIRLLNADAVPDTLVIKARTVEACTVAERIVNEARSWAEAHREEVQATIRQAELDAQERGYAEGLRQFLAAADDYAQARDALAVRVEDVLAKCLSRVFGEYPARDVLRRTVLPVLNSTVPDDDLLIAIHPDQLGDFEAVLADFERQSGVDRSIEIEPREDMTKGECVIYSSSEVIHAGIHVLSELLLAAISDVQGDEDTVETVPEMTGDRHG